MVITKGVEIYVVADELLHRELPVGWYTVLDIVNKLDTTFYYVYSKHRRRNIPVFSDEIGGVR